MLAALLAVSVSVSSAAVLSDDALVNYASRFHGSHDWRSYPANHVIGIHHGAPIIAEVHYGDICPDYTRLVIHYETAPGPACKKAGGIEEHVAIPIAIAVMDKAFCVPRVLAEKHLYSAP
jgi:hypothetical protein